MQIKGFFFNLKSQMSHLTLLSSFEYLCYGSTTIISLTSFSAGIDFRRENLMGIDVRCCRLSQFFDISIVTLDKWPVYYMNNPLS